MIRVVLMTDFSESYANKLVKGMAKYSFEHTPIAMCKMPLSVYTSGGLEKVLEFALKWKADAIIGQFRDGDDVDIFRRNGIFAIAQDNIKRFKGITNITSDYEREGRICAQYLIKQGARNFGFYGLSGRVWSDERKEGFMSEIEETLDDAGISVIERPCMEEIWWYDMGRVTEWLRSLPKPVAILACDDNIAFNIIEACNQLNESGMHIPDDVMLLGVDDDDSLCQLCSPTLSSYRPMIEQAGYNVAKMLDERMKMPIAKRFEELGDIYVHMGSIVTRRSTDVFFHENPYIKKVCDYIQKHYTENIKVDELVALIPMSRRLLEKLFANDMKVSIHQFIIHLRINRMITLLTQGMSPQEAANAMGMDLKPLSRSFKVVVGKAPSEYAKGIRS